MAKKMKKLLGIAMAAILCTASVVPALADDVVVDQTEDTLTVTTTVTNEDGEEVVTVTIEKTEELKVEKSEYDEAVQPGQEIPEIEIELVPGESVTKTVTGDTVTETTGDLPESSEDKDFDFTTTTTTTEREVTVEAGDVEIEVTYEDTTGMKSIAPEDYEGKKYDTHEKITGFTQSDGLLNGMNPEKYTADEKPEGEEEEYDLYLSGTGDATWAAAPVFMNVVYQRDENGNARVDEDGNYLIDEEKSGLVYAGDKAGYSGMNGTPGQIVLKNEENGKLFYTYCIDKATLTNSGNWYTITNLEDSDYYPDDESANKLRAIVTNGYWGTEEGTGSLESIKQLLRDTYGEEDTVTITDAKDNEHTYDIEDLIDSLAEHEALAATQAAIWSYSNGSLAAQNGEDGIICIGVYSAKKYFNGNAQDSPLNQYSRAYNLESDARLMALYDCLMGLEGISAENNDKVTTVINDKNAVEDMTLVVGKKSEGHANNADDNDDNDVYDSGISFTLAFVPDPETDDLLVYLTDAEGNAINDAEGNPIVRRLVGENSEGREADTILPDENGVYTLTGLQLQEKSDFIFDLRLEGTQYLKEGVYVYSAIGGRGDSQTLVGLAEGERDVEVSVGMTITFDVDESNHVVAERVWKKSTTTTSTKKTPAKSAAPAAAAIAIEEEGVPLAASADDLVEILDEEVPLADAPETGDNSIIYVLVSLISLCGASLLILKRRTA